MHHILEKVDLELAKQLRSMHPAQCRELLINACDFMSGRISLDSELAALLTECKSVASLIGSKQQALILYADTADGHCFDLRDARAKATEWYPWFQRARLATAFAKISEMPTWEDMAEGFYELTVIFVDPSLIVEFIKRHLPEVQA